ncbi:centrosomin isoform X2 [Cylas formicarius]|uniref:centrosomin isoform X2 n=1 Tax=Cylas formicarius TaxID=197179 RepID=UPI002958635E|nr:centrosomin isoform X2 [Cylas formicarius]
MADGYLRAVLKNSVSESTSKCDGGVGQQGTPSVCSSVCSSSKNSSIGDFEELDGRAMGLRSPNCPMRGRTVKEYEEQMTNLKKENFNLKLRIYFLEEKLGTHFTLDSENILKKNIEFQMEIANLQKEVREKHELLCQAVKAMELEDEEHKKYSQHKEQQALEMRQELEELRTQLHESKIASTGMSVKSENTAHSNKPNDDKEEDSYVTLLEEKLRCMELENQLHVQNEESAQFFYDQSHSLRNRVELQQKELQAKDETIDRLNRDIDSANERLVEFAKKIKDYEEKLQQAHRDSQNRAVKIQEQQKNLEDLYEQYSAVGQKYSSAKYELEKERKSARQTKMMSDAKIGELENELEKNKLRVKDLQSKLDRALVEVEKSQNLAVSTSPTANSRSSNIDGYLVSVPDAAASDGTAQKDSLHVPLNVSGTSSTSSSAATTPDGRCLSAFESLLRSRDGGERLLREFGDVRREFVAYKQKIVKLKSEQLKACEIIKSMIDMRNRANEEIAQLKKTKTDLERELETRVAPPRAHAAELDALPTTGTPPCEKQFTGAETKHSEMVDQYKALIDSLEAKVEVLEETVNAKDCQLQKVRDHYEELLEEKDNRIVDLEFELLSANQSSIKDRSAMEKSDFGTEKRSSFYRQELEEKDKEIERLNNELKKCTCYLQEIVNKELWEKNREIEKLHKKRENAGDVSKLRKVLSLKDVQLHVLKEKISELGLEIPIPDDESLQWTSQNTEDRVRSLEEQLVSANERVVELEGADKIIAELKATNRELTREMQQCEQLRLETNEVCSVLGTRLEELAVFLDSLLKQKSVLGFLGSAKNKKLREIISNSLDLSRSFSVSLMGNPEESLAQLSNITAFLNGSVFQNLSLADGFGKVDEENSHLSIIPSNITLTYESHLYKKRDDAEPNDKQVIEALREQVVNLKSELKLRDNELSRLNNRESGIEKLSESEEEKRPSQLFTPSKSHTSATLKPHSDVQSESEAWSEPDRVVSRARIGLNHSAPLPFSKSKRLNYNESTEDDDRCQSFTGSKRRASVIELHQEICRLENELKENSLANQIYCEKLQDMNQEVDEMKQRLARVEKEKHEADQQITDLKKTVEELSYLKAKLEDGAHSRNKELLDKINCLEAEKESLLKDAMAFEKQAQNAQNEMQTMKESIAAMEVNIRTEYEKDLIGKLKDAEDVFIAKMRKVEEKYEVEMTNMSETIQHMHEEYDRDYVKKSDVDVKLKEIETLASELADLKLAVQSHEDTIAGYKRREAEIKNAIQEYNIQTGALERQYADAVLERSKLNGEKLILEEELNKVRVKEEGAQRELKDTQHQLMDVMEKYQEQVATLQGQRSNLELKLSELESANADLRNKLIKMQTGKLNLNTSMPDIGSRQLVPYKRQCSDQNYSSEDNAEEMRSFCFGRSIAQRSRVEAERTEANSSPDLGIESDHGRFSSLETQSNNVPRPLLQTIELTESMSNLFDEQNNQIQAPSCANQHCCQTSLDISRENNELKRKLLRMKRALEETATQLSLANQRKRQVEKTICKQIHKTSQVLRKAKANLDSGSESEVFRM